MALRPPARVAALLPLFLVSMATVGFEIALTRYFAVAKWSEYGYWVISIVLAGFALSGVVMSLAQPWFARRGAAILAILPAAMIVTAAVGYHLVTANPFNPLQLQNQATFWDQIANIGLYYVDLLPFFFLAGVFVSLSFVLNADRLGRVYGFDLTGAGAGALLVLALMLLVHPFRLAACLLVPLAVAAAVGPNRRVLAVSAAVLALVGGEALLLLDDPAAYNDFKAIYAPLHVPQHRVLAEIRSPRGVYALLDDFTERLDTDVSNDAGMLHLPGPPQTYGLYRDGTRIAALPKPSGLEANYAAATLAALPYTLLRNPRVLLAGASGGFRIAEALTLGAARVDAAEPEPVLRRAIGDGLGTAPAMAANAAVRLHAAGPLALARSLGPFDLVDLSADFLDSAEANASAFTAEGLAADLRALAPGGILSVPVSIREFPAYALRMLATVRAALREAGVADPAANVIVYRSAWNVRILAAMQPFDAARIAAARAFCDQRSFDVSYYPGIDVVAARANIYNDLPAVSFSEGEVTSGAGAHDAIADEAGGVLAGQDVESGKTFDLSPTTFDRPAFYALLRLNHLGTVLRRLELLPQAEIAPLVNLAVLAQAVVIALVVLAVPLVGGARLHAGAFGRGRAVVYFAALGLGFLFIEIFAIERASFYLNDRTSAFGLVLTAMLVCSGLGAMASSRFTARPRRGLLLVAVVVVAWCALALLALQPAMLATLTWPWPVRAGLVLLAVAPISLALGLPFPLGLGAATQAAGAGFLPWVWGLNGAFSVVATPLANLIVLQFGNRAVLLCAFVLYLTAIPCFPRLRKNTSWQDNPAQATPAT